MKQAKQDIHDLLNWRKTNLHAINNGLHTTKGDPNQVPPPVYINTAQATTINSFTLLTFSFQMVATGTFMRLEIKFSMLDTWRTETMLTYYSYWD